MPDLSDVRIVVREEPAIIAAVIGVGITTLVIAPTIVVSHLLLPALVVPAAAVAGRCRLFLDHLDHLLRLRVVAEQAADTEAVPVHLPAEPVLERLLTFRSCKQHCLQAVLRNIYRISW